MTYEEMLEKIREEGIYVEGYDWEKRENARPLRQVSGNEYISVEWVSGGVTGNSCWGHDPSPRMGDSPKELESLNQILELLCPGISYLQFKKIDRRVVMSEKGDGGDYYGNYTEYRVKTLKLKDLYEELSSMGLI